MTENVEMIGRGAYRMAVRPATGAWRFSVVDEVSLWLREKGADLDLTREVRVVVDGRNIRVMHHRNGGVDAFLLSMTETNQGGTFVTTVLAVDDPDDPWLMVRVASNRRSMVPAPRLARRLLERTELLDGKHALTAQPQLIHAGTVDDLVARLGDTNRRGVVLAIGTGEMITPSIITPKLDGWVRDTAGLAQTVVLTPEATVEFAQRAGAYGVPEGTIRTYGRGLDLDAQHLARTHRMLSPHTVSRSHDWQVRNLLTTFVRGPLEALPLPGPLARWDRTFDRLLNREMTDRIVAPRAAPAGPAVTQDTVELERVRITLGVPDLTDATLSALLEAATSPSVDVAAIEDISLKVQEMQQEKETLEDELEHSKEVEWQARQEALEADERASESDGSLRRLQRRLRELNMDPWAITNGTGNHDVDDPEWAGSWTDLIDRVNEWERFGVFISADPSSMLEMDALDMDGRALHAAHEALLALAGYVAARRLGDHDQDFGRYLELQPAGYATYPRNRFAPTETNWTKQHHGRERELPVPAWVCESGTATINAHLRLTKIPNKDPRVYFMDAFDPEGRFCVVVGYLGQHLTNRSTSGLN